MIFDSNMCSNDLISNKSDVLDISVVQVQWFLDIFRPSRRRRRRRWRASCVIQENRSSPERLLSETGFTRHPHSLLPYLLALLKLYNSSLQRSWFTLLHKLNFTDNFTNFILLLLLLRFPHIPFPFFISISDHQGFGSIIFFFWYLLMDLNYNKDIANGRHQGS